MAKVRRKRRRRQRIAIDWVSLRRVALSLWPYLALALLAFALRLLVIPDREVLTIAPTIGDEGNYQGIASEINAGRGIPDRWPWLRPPGYPLVLVALLQLTGDNLYTPLLLNAALGPLTAVVVAILAAHIWGRRASLLAMAWVALAPSLIFATRLVHTETISTLLLTISGACLVCWMRRPTARWLIAGSLTLGLTALFRPSVVGAVALMIIWCGWWAWRTRGLRNGLVAIALFLGCWLIPIAPVTVHNWLNYQRFILLDTTAGYNLWRDHRDITLLDLNSRLMQISNPGDRQQYAIAQGLVWMRANPAETVRRSVRNLQALWGSSAYAIDAIDKRVGRADTWRAAWGTLDVALWLLLISGAIVAMWRAPNFALLVPPVILAVLGPSLGVALTHPENRFVLPSIPLLVFLAVGTVASAGVAPLTRRRTWGTLAAVAIVLLSIAPVSVPLLLDWGRPTVRFAVGRVAEAFSWDGLATRSYTAAANERTTPSEPRLRLALLAQRRGDSTQALALARRALAAAPQNFRASALIAQLLRVNGDVAGTQQVSRGVTAASLDMLDWSWDRAIGPPPGQLVLDGTDIGFVRGGYGSEQGANGLQFRWTGARSAYRLTAPPAGPAQLTLVLASPPSPAPSLTVATVRANGRVIGQVTVQRDPVWNTLTLPLPDDLDRTTPVLIELTVPTISLPPDRRSLGLAVSQVGLSPRAQTDELPLAPVASQFLLPSGRFHLATKLRDNAAGLVGGMSGRSGVCAYSSWGPGAWGATTAMRWPRVGTMSSSWRAASTWPRSASRG